MLELYMYHVTADIGACRIYDENLSKVSGEYLESRNIVLF